MPFNHKVLETRLTNFKHVHKQLEMTNKIALSPVLPQTPSIYQDTKPCYHLPFASSWSQLIEIIILFSIFV